MNTAAHVHTVTVQLCNYMLYSMMNACNLPNTLVSSTQTSVPFSVYATHFTVYTTSESKCVTFLLVPNEMLNGLISLPLSGMSVQVRYATSALEVLLFISTVSDETSCAVKSVSDVRGIVLLTTNFGCPLPRTFSADTDSE